MPKKSSRMLPLLPWADAPVTTARAQQTDRSLAALLAQRSGRTVEVTFGRSRTLPVQMRRFEGTLRLRLHTFFLAAPDDVIEALVAWMAHGRRSRAACACLDTWIDAELGRLPARPRRDSILRPGGIVHDLTDLARELHAGPWLTDLAALPGLTWGRVPGRQRQARSSLQLGLFDPETDLVRIHPVLDDDLVPAWFVRSVLFHELLHAAIPPHRDGAGRWIKHGPEFRRRERAFEDHGRAQTWLHANIRRLLLAARSLRRAT